MLAMKIKDIKQARVALRKHLLRKDIQSEENKQESGETHSSNNTGLAKNTTSKAKSTTSGGPLLDKNGNLVECYNCKHSKKANSNHYMWNCTNLGFCYECRVEHFPLGPDCPNKDSSKFDYDKFIARQQKNGNEDNKVDITNKFQKKKAIAATNKPTPSLPAAYMLQMAQSNEDQFIEQCKKYYKSQIKGLKNCKTSGKPTHQATSDDEVITKTHDEYLAVDSGASETFINNLQFSDSDIRLTPMGKTKDQVQIAAGDPIDLIGTGDILNHTAHYTPEFHTSLLSVRQTLHHNDALALFTEKDVHVVSNTPIIKKLFNLIIKLSKKNKTLILNGNVVNGLYLVKGSSILKNKLQDLKENEIDLDKINLIPNKNFNYNHEKLTSILSKNLIKEKDKIKFAGPPYYTNIPTAQVSTAAELVRYF